MQETQKVTTKQADSFVIEGYEIDEDTGQASLNYSFRNYSLKHGQNCLHSFSEKIDFGKPLSSLNKQQKSVLGQILSHLSIAAGVSYYKAFIPDNIIVSHCELSPDETVFFEKMYHKGLSEFAYRNEVDLNINISSSISGDEVTQGADGASDNTSTSATKDIDLPRRSAVLIGGGKDSMVSVEVLRAGNEPMVLFAVNPRQPIYDCADDSGIEMVVIKRTLDAELFALNESGALNGHVPITGIISFIAAAAAIIHGFDTIILSNERSANEGNLTHKGEDVNHQYSKSIMFEDDFSKHLTKRLTPSITYFSLLRPLSELRIAREFSRTDRYDQSFTSCNKAFRITNRIEGLRWCGDCAKCRFVYLVLATTTSKERLKNIFGKDMLDDIDQLEGYKELTGLQGHKPWDCVGEIIESLSAVHYLANDPVWSKTTVIAALADQAQARINELDSEFNGTFSDIWKNLLSSSEEHRLPSRYLDMLNDYLGQS